jgi:formate dehydrogenase subunit gamma
MFYWLSSILGVLMGLTGLVLIYKGAFELPTICITSTIHNLLGFFLIAGVVAHAYLGTVANPGTWRVLVDGSVTRGWAEHHHPNWFRKLNEQERIEEAEAKYDQIRSERAKGDDKEV